MHVVLSGVKRRVRAVQGYNLKLRELHRATIKLLAQHNRNDIHDIPHDLMLRPICKPFQIQGNPGVSVGRALPSAAATAMSGPQAQAQAVQAMPFVARKQMAVAQAQQAQQAYTQQQAQQIVQHAQRQAATMQHMHAQQAHGRVPQPPQPPRAVFTPPRSGAAAGARPQVSMATIAAAAASAAASYQGPRPPQGVRPQHLHSADLQRQQQQHFAAQQARMVRPGCSMALPQLLLTCCRRIPATAHRADVEFFVGGTAVGMCAWCRVEVCG